MPHKIISVCRIMIIQVIVSYKSLVAHFLAQRDHDVMAGVSSSTMRGRSNVRTIFHGNISIGYMSSLLSIQSGGC